MFFRSAWGMSNFGLNRPETKKKKVKLNLVTSTAPPPPCLIPGAQSTLQEANLTLCDCKVFHSEIWTNQDNPQSKRQRL